MPASASQSRRFKIAVLASLLVLAALSAAPVLARVMASSAPVLAVTPGNASAGIGSTADFRFNLSGFTEVQGVDIRFSFDPTVVQAVDTDGGQPGVQVLPGDCPFPDFVILNDVDNAAGTGSYAAVEFVTNCAAGDAFTLTLQCMTTGSSPVTITASAISDPDGQTISHSVQNGSILCGSTPTPTATPDFQFWEYLPVITRN